VSARAEMISWPCGCRGRHHPTLAHGMQRRSSSEGAAGPYVDGGRKDMSGAGAPFFHRCREVVASWRRARGSSKPSSPHWGDGQGRVTRHLDEHKVGSFRGLSSSMQLEIFKSRNITNISCLQRCHLVWVELGRIRSGLVMRPKCPLSDGIRSVRERPTTTTNKA